MFSQTGDSFVIVASDGLWDELSTHEACFRCAQYLQLAEESERVGVAQVRRLRSSSQYPFKAGHALRYSCSHEPLHEPTERPSCMQHLIDYALDKAAQRLQRQEPELGVKVRGWLPIL